MHPGIAALPCEECQRNLYKIPSGVPETYQIEPGGESLKMERPPGTEPPCDQCPKGGPENEPSFRMSWENHLTYQLYRRVRSGGHRLPDRLENDPIIADNFALIDEVLENADRQRSADALAISIVRYLGWGSGR